MRVHKQERYAGSISSAGRRLPAVRQGRLLIILAPSRRRRTASEPRWYDTNGPVPQLVMAGLDPAIHVARPRQLSLGFSENAVADVDGRVKPGHDDLNESASA